MNFEYKLSRLINLAIFGFIYCNIAIKYSHGLSTQICNDPRTFNGKWTFLPTNESSDESVCSSFIKEWAIALNNYSCATYRSAIFKPNECSLLPLHHSISLIDRYYQNGSIIYLGDSLNGQLFLAVRCELTRLSATGQHITNIGAIGDAKAIGLDMDLKYDFWLRPDIPCYPDCLTNTTFRELAPKFKRYALYCEGCPDGNPRDQLVLNHEFNKTIAKWWWMDKLPKNTRVLIIDSGPWYNEFQGVSNSTLVYTETMRIIRPILQRFVEQGMIIVWIPIPPPILSQFKDWEIYVYELEYFKAKNMIAQRILEPVGVLFINQLQAILEDRKKQDSKISFDGLHWCNPGRTSMPLFINQVLFHFIAVKIHSRIK